MMRIESQANAHCAVGNGTTTPAAGMKRALVGSPRGGARLQRLSMDVTGGESAAPEFNYPSESASRIRSIAGCGLTGRLTVSGPRSAVLLTAADPDADEGARELQRVRCPAFFRSNLRRSA